MIGVAGANTLSGRWALRSALPDHRVLRRLADRQSYERGEQYFLSGRVRAFGEHEGTVTARVLGTEEYSVRLSTREGTLTYSCTCPVGAGQIFCKHCVAVALTWITAHSSSASRQRSACRTSLVALRTALRSAIRPRRFINYASASAYAFRIDGIIDTLDGLLNEGRDPEVISLTEYALTAVEKAIESVDDSDGYMREIIARLEGLHHAACTEAKPDPKALAERLFMMELRSEYDIFHGAAARYADVLGEEGLAAYRRLAEAQWARVPPLSAGKAFWERAGTRFRITRIMETLAQQSGDTEALVAVKARDLSHPYAYLEIAEIYRRAHKLDSALEWAERGLRAFPYRTDSRLREFVAGQYHRLNRHREAMALAWAEFTDRPDLERYQLLKSHADRTSRWTEWREKAVAEVRRTIVSARRETQEDQLGHFPPDASTLVQIFLWENDPDGAWREAQALGCSTARWLLLASLRAEDHPRDALAIYQSQIESTLARKNNDAYEEAVGLLRRIRVLMRHLGRGQEFTQYLEGVRANNRPKRNFIRLLEGTRWS